MAIIYFSSGVEKHEKGDYQGAIADYTKALEINPQDADSYENRGAAKDELEDFQGAIADLNKALQIDPESVIAYFNRGNTKSSCSWCCRD